MVRTELDHASVKPPLSPGRQVALVLGGLIAVAVIAWGGFGIYNLLTPVTTKQDQIRLPIEQAKLSVDVDSGDVTVRRGSGTEVVVDRTMRYRATEPRVVERSSVDGIRIEADCTGMFSWSCEVSYDITLPDGFDLDLAASSGGLTVRDLAVQRLRHDASSGDVELVGVTGPVDLRVSSGTITADRLTSDDVYVEASSGDVDLDFAAAPRKVVADVSSGRIEIGLPDGKYNVDVDVDSGEQRVDVPVDTTSDRLIQARASSGDIEIVRNGR
ncbi:MAG: DUF4097 family beta strand repeat-containing protein [Pseudonocardia sp.]